MKNEWTIYGQSGISDVLAVVRELEYHGGWMEYEFVTVTIKSTVPIKFKHGDYLTYRDERFSIDYDPSTIQKARKESYDEAFVYENVKLYSDWHAFKDVLFKDYVLNDNGLAYSQQAKFSFFAGSIEDLADRLQANLNRAFGTNVWKIYTPDSVRSGSRHNGSAWSTYYQSSGLETGNKDINVSCDSISCKEALKQSYDLFGLPFIVIGKNVIIGGNKGLVLSKNLEYGKEKGLYEVDKTIDDDQQVITKMFAYGASDNLPLNYYANLHKSYRATISSVDNISSSEVTPFVEITLTMDYKQSLFTQVDRWTDSQGNTFNNFGYVVKFKFNDTEITARVNNPKDSDDGKVHIYAEYSGGEDPADEPSLSKMQAFRNYVASGRVLVFTAGFDKNRWPSDGIDYGASQNYPALLSISNLMLPGFPDMSLYQWVLANGGTSINADTGLAGWRTYTAYFSKDAQRPWIKSLKSDNIGDREGAVYFDGSDNDVEKIYPTIGSGNNTVIQKSSVSDNGYLAEGTDISFKLRVIKGTFDWNEAWNDKQEDIYVNMTSGFCCGRAFKVLAKPEKKSSYWELKLERAYDSSLGRYFPYQDKATANDMSSYAQVVANDTFVVTGIQLPQSFVDSAAIKLLTAALERLAKIDHPKVNYIPKISEIFAAKDREENEANSLYRKIRAGMMITFKDTTTENKDPQTGNIVHETITQRIDTITIKENGNNGIPTFDVVLRNDKEEDFQQRLKNQLSAIGGESKSSSSNQGISESDIEELTDGMMSAKLFTRLFEVYGKIKNEELSDAEDAEETLISPKYWEKVFKEDDERWESWQSSHPDEPYHSLLNIKAKRGLWTEFYMSALGKGSGEGGGGGAELNEPLYSINEQEMGYPPNNLGKVTIVWNPVSGEYEWGKTGGGVSGLTLKDHNDVITPLTQSDDNVTYDLAASFLSLKNGGEVRGILTLSRPQDFDLEQALPSTVLTKGETETLFNGKFVTVEFWNSLFETYNGTTKVNVNTENPVINNLKILVGTWTEQYLSALGQGSSQGGGTLDLFEPLNSINKINRNPSATEVGDTLVWMGAGKGINNSGWGYGNSGIDETALASYLQRNKYIKADDSTKWWGRTMTNGVVKGDIEDADDIYINSGKYIRIKDAGTNYSVFGYNPSDSTLLIGWGLKGNAASKTTITAGSSLSIGTGTNAGDTYGKYWTMFRDNGHVTVNANDVVDAGNTTRNIFLNVGGSVKANRIYLYTNSDSSKDVYLEYIDRGTNKGVHLVGDGFWTDHFVSALGTGTTSGNTFDLDPLLNSLHSSGLNPSVQGEQVLVNTNGSWSWEPYGGGSVTNLKTLTIKGGTTNAVVYDPADAAATLTVNGQKNDNKDVLTVTADGTAHTLTIALANNYGDTKNPYASKTAGYVLAAPSDQAGTPAFRPLTAAFISDLSLSDQGVITIGSNSITPLTDAKLKSGYLWWGQSLTTTTVSGVTKTEVSGSMTGVIDITMSGNVRMNRGQFIKMYVNNEYRNVLGVDSTLDILSLGYRTAEQGLDTRIFGTAVKLWYYNDTAKWQEGLTLTSTGQVGIGGTTSATDTKLYVNGNIRTGGNNGNWIQIGQLRLIYEENGGNKFLRLADTTSGGGSANFYATGAVSALGSGSSSNPFDLSPLLNSLNTYGPNPSAAGTGDKVLVYSNSSWVWQEYGGGGGGGVSDDYLPLIIPGSGKTVSMPSIGALTFKSSASDYPLIRFEGKTSGGLGFIGIGKTGSVIDPYYVTAVNGGYVDGQSQWYTLLHTGNLTAQLSGKITNDMLANKSITIDGTSVDLGGTFTSSKWGPSRNVTIKDYDETHSGEAVSVDGSGAVALKLPSTIKASLTGNAATATNLSDTAEYKAWGQTFFISGKPKAIGNDSSHASLNYVSSITMSGNIYQKSTTLVRGTVPANRTVMAHAWQDKNSKNLGWLEFVAEAQGESSTSSVVNHVGLFILGQHSGDNAYGGLIIQKTVGNTDNRSVVFDANTGLLDTNTIKANRFYLYKPNADDTNAVYFIKDSTGVRLVNAGFYADGFVSALGTGSSGGGSSFDEDTMWRALQNGYGHSIGSTNSYLRNIFAINGNFSFSLKVNGSKVLTSADLDDYLPKTGGTLTGQLTVKANLFQPFCVNSTHASTDATCIQFGHTKNDAFTDYGGILMDSANGYLKRYTSGVANSYTILDSGNYTSYFTDTKNTAGASQKQSTTMYLVGTASFNQNYAVTNINGSCYIGSDNCLYSNGSKVLTSAGGTLTGALTVSSGNTGESINVRTTKTYACITYGQSSGDNWSVGSNSSNQFYFYNSNKAKVVAYITRDGDIYSNGSKVLTSSNGVTLDTDQSISGAKTFSKIVGIGGSNNSGYRLKVVYNTVTESSITYNRGLLATGLSKFDYIGINTDPVTGKRLKVNGDTLLEGKLSVGTSNTDYNLYVNGTSYMNGDTTVNGTLTANTFSFTNLTVSGDTSLSGKLYIGDTSVYMQKSTITSGGNIFTALDIRSAIICHNGNSIHTSDMRLKDIVSYISDLDVEGVARAPIFNFKRKDRPEGFICVGTSAQYWATVLPNAVVDVNGILSLDYSATALAAAVMTARTVLTHEEEIARLKRTVDEQARKIGELEQEVELLKAA